MRTGSSSAATATALAAVAALMLSACGGSGGDDAKTHASGKHTAKPKASPKPSPSGSASAGAPEITFGPNEKTVYDDWTTGESSKDTILRASSKATDAYYAAIGVQKETTPAVKYYLSKSAYSSTIRFTHGWVKDKDTWIGELRLFRPKLTMMPDGTASVIYCSDESKAFVKHLKTGKTDHNPTTSNSFVLYNTRLTKNQQGVWQTTFIYSKRGASECQL